MISLLPTVYRLVATASVSGNTSVCSGSGSPGTPTYCDTGLPQVGAGTPELTSILQVVFGTLAVVSVLFIMIGAFRFVWSQGNPENSSKARSTIIYAVVGLIISISAEGLVTFVLGKL